VDIYRERSLGVNRVEDIQNYASDEEQGLVSFEETPLSAMETDNKNIVIRRAIDNLSTRLRETFILHFYQELSHQKVVQKQAKIDAVLSIDICLRGMLCCLYLLLNNSFFYFHLIPLTQQLFLSELIARFES
jgi:hypothetical protein